MYDQRGSRIEIQGIEPFLFFFVDQCELRVRMESKIGIFHWLSRSTEVVMLRSSFYLQAENVSIGKSLILSV